LNLHFRGRVLHIADGEEARQMTLPIRVVVANQPRLMRELVLATIGDQPDIEVIAEIQDERDIAGVVEGTRPDFLIIALNEMDEPAVLCDTLLRRHPEMKILALAPERNVSIFYWASVNVHTSHAESSEAGILNSLRGKNQRVGWAL
jgi:chemotaxis response regulator CheB